MKKPHPPPISSLDAHTRCFILSRKLTIYIKIKQDLRSAVSVDLAPLVEEGGAGALTVAVHFVGRGLRVHLRIGRIRTRPSCQPAHRE